MPNNLKILVVDDDINFCGSISKVLVKKGFEVDCAHIGSDAIKMAGAKTFDVVLMDIKMAAMNGVEVYKKLKALNPDAQAILMTAFPEDDLVKEALKDGVYAVVHKPFSIDTILNMIDKTRTGARVAIVDDDPGICSTMKLVLERKGYGISTCLSGEDAISLAKTRHHDIYFIDMKLKALNGLDTYLEIKKVDPDTIVVVMTGYRQEMDAEVKRVIDSGAYVCLYKPFEMDDAIRIVDAVANRLHR